MSQVMLLEELSLNAYPGVQMLHYDGWVLCLSPGRWRRSNSIQVLQPSILPLEQKIAYCEGVYTAQDKRTVFKLTRETPLALEAALIERGYALDAETSVQTIALDGTQSVAEFEGVTVTLEPEDAFTEPFFRIHHMGDSDRGPWQRIQQGVLPLCGYMRLDSEGETAAVAIGVVERGWLGVFGVGVAPEQRRLGHARRIMQALQAWGAAQGAAHSYLQVMTDNPAALALYDQIGYREAYQYWYRQK
jgi:ribosomal protein S18 acetylase RimI-like enzyme